MFTLFSLFFFFPTFFLFFLFSTLFPEFFVCGSMFNMVESAHMQQLQQLQQQSSSQRVGALSLIPFCMGITGHPSGSWQGHPRYTGARSAGQPRVSRTLFSTAVQCRNTAKHGSGAMSIQGKNCNKIHENHDDQSSVKCPIPGDGYRRRSGMRRP